MFMPDRLHLVICSFSEKQVVGCTLIVGVHINKSDRKRWSEAWEYILPSVCVCERLTLTSTDILPPQGAA